MGVARRRGGRPRLPINDIKSNAFFFGHHWMHIYDSRGGGAVDASAPFESATVRKFENELARSRGANASVFRSGTGETPLLA